MKRWFSVIISHSTVWLNNLFGRKREVDDKGLMDAGEGQEVCIREDAKEVDNPISLQMYRYVQNLWSPLWYRILVWALISVSVLTCLAIVVIVWWRTCDYILHGR